VHYSRAHDGHFYAVHGDGLVVVDDRSWYM